MRSLVRLYFIIILCFSSITCFAGSADEYLELTDMMVPFITNFNDSSSISRLLSLKLVEYQKENGHPLTKREAEVLINTWKKEKPFTDRKFSQMIDVIRAFCTPTDGETYAEAFATALQMFWENKVANCGDYTYLVMVAFEFNQMNNIAQGKGKKPIFREAMIVRAVPGSGDHSFVLVEGKSGAMFAIDPWGVDGLWVKKLDNFVKLSDINPSISNFKEVWPEDEYGPKVVRPEGLNLNLILSRIYISKPYKGKSYYDVRYVNEDTEWELSRVNSEIIWNYVHERDEGMERLYKVLQPKFHWKKNYDELPLRPATLRKADSEHKEF